MENIKNKSKRKERKEKKETEFNTYELARSTQAGTEGIN